MELSHYGRPNGTTHDALGSGSFKLIHNASPELDSANKQGMYFSSPHSMRPEESGIADAFVNLFEIVHTTNVDSKIKEPSHGGGVTKVQQVKPLLKCCISCNQHYRSEGSVWDKPESKYHVGKLTLDVDKSSSNNQV